MLFCRDHLLLLRQSFVWVWSWSCLWLHNLSRCTIYWVFKYDSLLLLIELLLKWLCELEIKLIFNRLLRLSILVWRHEVLIHTSWWGDWRHILDTLVSGSIVNWTFSAHSLALIEDSRARHWPLINNIFFSWRFPSICVTSGTVVPCSNQLWIRLLLLYLTTFGVSWTDTHDLDEIMIVIVNMNRGYLLSLVVRPSDRFIWGVKLKVLRLYRGLFSFDLFIHCNYFLCKIWICWSRACWATANQPASLW